MPAADAYVHLFRRLRRRAGRAPVTCDELAAYERLRRHHGIERALVIGPGRFQCAPAPERAREHLAPLLALAGRERVAVKLR